MKLVVLPTLAATDPAAQAASEEIRVDHFVTSVSTVYSLSSAAVELADRPGTVAAHGLGELPRAHPLHRSAPNEERLPVEPAGRRRQVGDHRRDVGRVPLVEHSVRGRP